MIANAIHTKWKFIVEFENEETGEIAVSGFSQRPRSNLIAFFWKASS